MPVYARTLSWFSLLCVVLALLIGPVFFGAVHVRFASLVQALAATGMVAVLVRVLISGRHLFRSGFDAALGACWFYVTIRYIFSAHEYQSRQEWLLASAAFWTYLTVR